MADAPDVSALASELGISAGLLYKWQTTYRRGGAAALRLPGERRPAGGVAFPAGVPGDATEVSTGLHPAQPPALDVAALERKVAQQALDLDFFRAALRHFAARRRPTGVSGGTGPMP